MTAQHDVQIRKILHESTLYLDLVLLLVFFVFPYRQQVFLTRDGGLSQAPFA